MRIVAYLLRETLGWLDKDGNPRQQNITVSYTDLIQRSGVSRGAIGPALKEATNAGFIVCRRQGVASSPGQSGQAAAYALCWDQEGEYKRELKTFKGFYSGEGHRTPVPNQFFDNIVRDEPLAIVKVVGTVIRHTMGYQNQFGGRRRSAELSQNYIAQYSGLSRGKVIAQATQAAENAGYVVRVDDGQFSHNAKLQRCVTYAVRWSTGSKSPAGEQSKNTSRTRSKSPAENRFKKPSTIKTDSKDNYKQQVVCNESEKIVRQLVKDGIRRSTACKILEKRGVEIVENQLVWLEARRPENRPAMLLKAIDENWDKPLGCPSSLVQS